MKTFVTFFPSYQDFHFYKDPGQIPFRFKRKGFDAYIIRFKSDSACPITESNIRIVELPTKRYGYGNLSVWHYMKHNACKIDILNLFHINFGSLFAAFAYKFFNSKGFAYLKMDNNYSCSPYEWEKIWLGGGQANILRRNIIKIFFADKVDLFSIEDSESLNYFTKKFDFLENKIIRILNGHTIDLFQGAYLIPFNKKANIIITASSIGTYSKATDILLAGFAKTANSHDWQLMLAGSIDNNYQSQIDDYFIAYPYLRNRVIFLGTLSKLDLFALYNKSKIFCLPSRYEGFANVYSEAMYFGNAIITTPTTSLKELIENFQLGLLVDVDDAEQLSASILYLINNSELNQEYGANAKEFCNKFLSWDTITDEILSEIQRRMQRK